MKIEIIHDELAGMTISILLLNETVVRLEAELFVKEQVVVVTVRHLFGIFASGHAEINYGGSVVAGKNIPLVVFWLRRYFLWSEIKNRFYLPD